MRTQLPKINFPHITIIRLLLVVWLLPIFGLRAHPPQTLAASATPVRRVNIPNLDHNVPFTPPVFWFGQVGLTDNHANVRVWYYDSQIRVVFHIIDRLLWFDPEQSETELTSWDAVSLYLNLDGDTGGAPGSSAYLFQSQLEHQAGFRGNGTDWEISPISFSTEASWRGNFPNDDIDDKGWQVEFIIPFTSLGLSGPPPTGTIWGLAAAVHDRDAETGSQIPDQIWPEGMQSGVPSTWGQMRFGVPGYTPPLSRSEGTTTIREGLNNAFVEDAHVGGHTTCGELVDHWTEWGNTNYAGAEQINIQNQWDISDYPCFSKYYVTFPLDSLPPGKTIISATLGMVLFGNSGGGIWGEPPDSYIQVLTIADDWDENTITWNNAPLASENISGTWVQPRNYEEPDPTYHWDISRAVADAYQNSEPLRLVLYSADGDYHTGKYFWSSDTGDWNASARPTIKVVWGAPCATPNVDCNFLYLPLAGKE
jgi:hypothetical protein